MPGAEGSSILHKSQKKDLAAVLVDVKERLIARGAKEPCPFEVWSQDPSKIGVAFSVHRMEPQTEANKQSLAYLVTCIQGASFSSWAQMKAFVLQLPSLCRVIPREGFPLLGNLYAERSFPLRKVQREPLAISDLTGLSVERAGVDSLQYFFEQMVTLVDRFQHPLLKPQGKRSCDTALVSLPPAKRQRKEEYAFSVWKPDKNKVLKPAEVRCAYQCQGLKKKHYGSLYCPSRKQ
jgi:hypothetical protein